MSFTGTETDFFAEIRGCRCLANYHRSHMFQECQKCGQGLECKDDYATLKPGYWWNWRNESFKDRYQNFIKNLLTSTPALGEADVQYPHPIPTPHRCPLEDSCEGGLDSPCKIGYKGPLCSVCSSGYYKQLHTCQRCPTKTWIAGQLVIIVVIIMIIIALSVWKSKTKYGKNEGQRSVIDTFLSKIKIAIGFYQVTYGLLEAFSYVSSPDSLQLVSRYSAILQLNILQIAPVHCLSDGLRVDAFKNLITIMAINACFVGFAGMVYILRKNIILRNQRLKADEKSSKVIALKEAVYRNLFFVLYVTYLNTCSNTASVLPISCRSLCQDKEEETCSKYLKADYSVQCSNSRFNYLVLTAYISVVYIIALPIASFVALWRHQTLENSAEDETNEIVNGLRFLFENYKPRSWYWELVEMSRKVIVTSGLVLLGSGNRSYIGLTWVVGGMYGVLFAWVQPIKDGFENCLMVTSLALTVVNLGIGAVSRIPEENIPTSNDAFMDGVIFNLVVLAANALVLGLLLCKTLFPLLFFPLLLYQSFVRSGTELNTEDFTNRL